jgi:tetratricopeptide (TPR) repeat protein
MEPIKKNRLKFESVEPLSNPNSPVYETDEYPALREEKKFAPNLLPWVLSFIIFILLLTGVGYWYFQDKERKNFGGDSFFSNKVSAYDRTIDRYYLPESSLNPKLAECINLYKSRAQTAAKLKCEEFLNRPESDADKSIAATVLGIIHDEKGIYEIAIEYYKNAIKYDSKNVYAYSDLSLAYKHAGRMEDARNTILKAKELSPNDVEIARQAGNILNDTNDPKRAMEVYKEGLNSSPDDPYTIYNLALTQYKQGLIPESIENFRKAIISNGKGQIAEFANAQLGSIYFHRDDLNGSEHHFREALSIKPNDSKYLYNLGIVLLKNKKPEEASIAFQKAVDSGSGDPQIYRYIAESFMDLKQFDYAAMALEKALNIKPDDIDSLFQLADLYYSKGQLSLAEELFHRIIKNTPGDTNTENALVNLGIILDDMERYQEAIEKFEKAISYNSKNDNAYYNLGIAYKNAGQASRALESFRRATVLNPSETKYKEVIGDYYFENGYNLEASREYEDLLKNNPYQHKVRIKLADVYYRQKEYELAEKNLAHVLNNSKSGEEIKIAHRKLALVYSEGDSKNKTLALESAYKGSHIDPDDMESRLVLAKVLIESNSAIDREKAIDELTSIIRSEVKPKTMAKAYNYLGLCYYKNNEFKKAIANFQNALDLDPSLTEAYENKRASKGKYEDYLQSKNSKL